MKKSFVLTAVVSLIVGVLAGVIFTLHTPTSTAQASEQRVIHVVEHAITDTVQEFHPHPPKMSLGDVLAFHNPVYDAADTNQVGNDNGHCIRTVATGKTEWECFWTVFLAQGQITVERPCYDGGPDTILVITDGVCGFIGAQGQMLLHARGNPVGSEYDFIYTLTE